MQKLIDALAAAIPVLQRAAQEDSIYGHYCGGDPRRFSPDVEECSPEEIAAHRAACEAWERGERPNIPKACEPLRDDISFTNEKGEQETIKAGTGLALYAPFGIGVQTYIDDQAVAALESAKVALEEAAPDVLVRVLADMLIESNHPAE